MTNEEIAKIKLSIIDLIFYINNHKYEELDSYLKDNVDWDAISCVLIQPKEVRWFIKEIKDNEVRLDVAKFLHKYARLYFREAAENAEYEEKQDGMFAVGPDVPIKTADERMALFQQQLAFLIQQEEEAGEFSGNKFHKQEEKIKELEERIKTISARNEELFTENERLKNPLKDKKYVPAKLQVPLWGDVMDYLQNKQILAIKYGKGEFGQRYIRGYQWVANHDLFGYFVDRISFELELRDSGGRLNWKLFKPAFENYKDIFRTAQNAVARYMHNSKINKPEDADIIDDAIKAALEKDAIRKAHEL